MKKRISAILLAAILCISMMVVTFAVESSATLELDSEGKVFTVNAEGLDPDMRTARATLVRCTYNEQTGKIGNVVAIGEEQFDVTDGKVTNGRFVLNAQFSEEDRNPDTTSLLIRVTVLGTRTGNTNYHNAVAFWPYDPTAKATYTVTFNLNGAPGTAPAAQTVTEGQTATKPADPTWEGHTFDGWFKEAACTNEVNWSDSITSNVTCYAKWTEIPTEHTVTFNPNYTGAPATTQTVTKGSQVNAPADPAREGYTFDGWFTQATGGNRITFPVTVTGDVTYYAHWTEKPAPTEYTVTFDRNYNGGGSFTETTEDGKVNAPADPVREGYIFDGWFTQETGGSKVTFPVTVTSDVTYYAQWTVAGDTSVTPVTPAPSRQQFTLVNSDGSHPKSVDSIRKSDGTLLTGFSYDPATGLLTLANPLSDGETIAIGVTMPDNTTTTVNASAPSTTTPPSDTGDNSGGTGSGPDASTANRVSVKPGITNGTVTVAPRQPNPNDEVTVTITPNEGYELYSISAFDKNNNPVVLAGSGNTRTFTMPNTYPVTIDARFKRIGEELPDVPTEPQPGTNPGTTTVTNPFSDVPENQYYYDSVMWAYSTGVTTGKTATTFVPDETCTRAQMVTYLWRYAGSPAPQSRENPFRDLIGLENTYFYDAVLWAVEKGITNGTTDTTFSPYNTVTRAQSVTFLWRFAGAPTVTANNPFPDVPSTQYFASAIQWAVNNRITNGYADSTFRPYNGCTRAQIVTFLYRYDNIGSSQG